MTENTPHVHQCGCGRFWVCARTDCYWAQACHACEDDAVIIWTDAHDPQPELPELKESR